MKHNKEVTLGDYVEFSYRKNHNLKLMGFVVNVLQKYNCCRYCGKNGYRGR